MGQPPQDCAKDVDVLVDHPSEISDLLSSAHHPVLDDVPPQPSLGKEISSDKDKDNKNTTYQVVCLSDLLEETNANRGRIPDGILELRPLAVLIHIHVVLESSVQQASEEGLEVVGLIWMDVDPVVGTLKEVATGALGRSNGIGKEEVIKPLLPKRDPARSNKDVLRLRIGAASATTSPTELRPVETPFELHKVGMNLSPAESVVADSVGVVGNPAGRGNGSLDVVAAGQHSDGD